MKIFMNDSTGFKFSQMIADYWRSKGHEVRQEIGANPEGALWADLIFIDFLDNNFYCYFNGPSSEPGKHQIEHYPKKGKLVVRGIDIDIWMGRHRDPRIWEYMDKMITIVPHHQKRVAEEGHAPEGKISLVRPGVDLEKFAFRGEPLKNYTIGMAPGDLWEMKNPIEGFRIFQMKQKIDGNHWKLKIRGQHNGRELEQVMKDHVLFSGKQGDVEIVPVMNDIREFYKSIDFLLVPSLKEAFSYATAEAMAMGVKPILCNWYGSEEIWPKEYIYDDLLEAVDMIAYEGYDPQKYRQLIVDNYDIQKMFRELDELLGT